MADLILDSTPQLEPLRLKAKEILQEYRLLVGDYGPPGHADTGLDPENASDVEYVARVAYFFVPSNFDPYV